MKGWVIVVAAVATFVLVQIAFGIDLKAEFGYLYWKDFQYQANETSSSSTNELIATKRSPGLSPPSLPLCTRAQIRQGKWIPKTYDKPWYIPVNAKRCHGRDGIQGANSSWLTPLMSPAPMVTSTSWGRISSASSCSMPALGQY